MHFVSHHAKPQKDDKDKGKKDQPRKTIVHGKKDSHMVKKPKDSPENFRPLEVRLPLEKPDFNFVLDRMTAQRLLQRYCALREAKLKSGLSSFWQPFREL